jgi:hypothetical protein
VGLNITQEAPGDSLEILRDLLDRLTYRAGWGFELRPDFYRGQGSRGTTLIITVTGPDSKHPEDTIQVRHFMLVPPASYNERSWKWWLFQQIGLVEQHERMEFFQLGGQPAYAPAHGPGNDPYLILDYGTDIDRRTSFRGDLNPE